MRLLALIAVLFLLVPVPAAEEYVCLYPPHGLCKARIQLPGSTELTCVWFRRGDIISTEAGWLIESRRGWRKIRTRPPYCLGLGELYDPDLEESFPFGVLDHVPTDPLTWLRPIGRPITSAGPQRLVFLGLGP